MLLQLNRLLRIYRLRKFQLHLRLGEFVLSLCEEVFEDCSAGCLLNPRVIGGVSEWSSRRHSTFFWGMFLRDSWNAVQVLWVIVKGLHDIFCMKKASKLFGNILVTISCIRKLMRKREKGGPWNDCLTCSPTIPPSQLLIVSTAVLCMVTQGEGSGVGFKIIASPRFHKKWVSRGS